MSVLDAIGGTRLVPLEHVVPRESARILVKLEYENPTGSMKDRMALAMVEAAERDGRLGPGGSVVEYTGGSTGVSLAFVCAAKRIPLQIVTSGAFSSEKRVHMQALGARLTLVASPTGGTTKALTLEMIETARKLAAAPGCYWTDQLNNADQLDGYVGMGEEVWEQARGQVSAFVQSVGTAGSLRGNATRLRAHDRTVHVVAVEPEASPVLSGGPPGLPGSLVDPLAHLGHGREAPRHLGLDQPRGFGRVDRRRSLRRLDRRFGQRCLFQGRFLIGQHNRAQVVEALHAETLGWR